MPCHLNPDSDQSQLEIPTDNVIRRYFHNALIPKKFVGIWSTDSVDVKSNVKKFPFRIIHNISKFLNSNTGTQMKMITSTGLHASPYPRTFEVRYTAWVSNCNWPLTSINAESVIFRNF